MTHSREYPVHRAAPRPVPAGFAISALVLGIVGVVLSPMPIINNFTAVGAVVGIVLGFIGIWKSWQWTSAIGVVLCGAAIVLTLYAQQKLSDELDRIENDLRTVPTFELPAIAP